MRVPLTWLRRLRRRSPTRPRTRLPPDLRRLEVEDIELRGPRPAHQPIAGLPVAGARDRWRTETGPGSGNDRHRPASSMVKCLTRSRRLTTAARGRTGPGNEPESCSPARPNLFPPEGAGPLPTPLKIVYAREGRLLIRGALSPAASHDASSARRFSADGRIDVDGLLREGTGHLETTTTASSSSTTDAPWRRGGPEYNGDVVLEVKINPNMRAMPCVLGIARRFHALTGRSASAAGPEASTVTGAPIAGRVGNRDP